MELAHPKILLTKEEIMGRAIEVDKKLDVLQARLVKVERLVDVVLDILEQQSKEEEVEEEKANDEGSRKSSRKSDNGK